MDTVAAKNVNIRNDGDGRGLCDTNGWEQGDGYGSGVGNVSSRGEGFGCGQLSSNLYAVPSNGSLTGEGFGKPQDKDS